MMEEAKCGLSMNGCNYSTTFQMRLIILMIITFLIAKTAVTLEKVDEPSSSVQPEVSIKCGECPCVNRCGQQQPPPPPPPPLTPPKVTQYCPPVTPPPPRFVYVTGLPEQSPPPPSRFAYVAGPPGNYLYPTDPFNLKIYSSPAPKICVGLLLLVGSFGLLEMFLWGL